MRGLVFIDGSGYECGDGGGGGVLTTAWIWGSVRLNRKAGGSVFSVETLRKEPR